MTKPRITPTIKRFAVAASVLWILGIGGLQLLGIAGWDSSRSSSFRLSLAQACKKKLPGISFAKRYECTSTGMYSSDRKLFVNGSKRIVIVFGPPLLLFIGFRLKARRRERMEAEAVARRKSIERKKTISASEQDGKSQKADVYGGRDRKASKGALPQDKAWSRATVSPRDTGPHRPSTVGLEAKPVGEPSDPDAQWRLGMMYENGKGALQDNDEAIRWYREAAEQGHAFAQVSLGNMYAEGRGGPEGEMAAYMWFNIAASAPDPISALSGKWRRDEMAEGMTPAQIAEAQRLARDWKPKKE